MRGLSLFDTAFVAFEDGVTDWATRVVANGGAMPSAPTIAAMETFRLGMISAGLDTKMHSLCVFVPDSLIAATTPLFVGIGSDPWTNNNFVGGDLTVDGLLGDAATKYLDTGVQAKAGQAINIGTGNCGLTLMVSQSNQNAVTVEMGAQDSSATNVATLAVFISGYTGAAGRFQTAFTPQFTASGFEAGSDDWIRTGYVSGNQVGGTSTVYVANDYQAHQVLATAALTTSATISNNTLFCFANNVGGSAASWTGQRLSLAAIHDGFDATESLNFYNLIVTLRTALGGGLGNPVDDWSNRVVVNGGAAPSAGTVIALKTFSSGLVTDGIYASMAVVNPVAPDNLTAARVPLICQTGNFIWTNNNFVGGDLTTSGLTGNASTKYLNTGIIPNACYKWSNGNGGMSMMISNVPTSSFYQDWASFSGVDYAGALLNYSGTLIFACWGYATTNDYSSAALPSGTWPGFITGSRTATNAIAVYRASTANAFAMIDSKSSAQSNVIGGATAALFAFAQNVGGSPLAGTLSDRTHSFYGAHTGLDATQSQALYNRVATLRTALGGGNP